MPALWFGPEARSRWLYPPAAAHDAEEPSTRKANLLGEEPMLIREPKDDPNRSKEVKVKIPVTHHIKLHSMKVLTGKQISDAITEALDAYFSSRAYEETMHRTSLA